MSLFPLQPLADRHGVTLAALGRHLGVSGTTWKRYRDLGVSRDVADRLAGRLGLHPAEVWPEWIEDASVECALDLCEVRFVPISKNHRFCSPQHRDRAKVGERARRNAERYRTDPAFREKVKAARRAFYAENAAYEKRREARRYWADPVAARASKKARRAANKAAPTNPQ